MPVTLLASFALKDWLGLEAMRLIVSGLTPRRRAPPAGSPAVLYLRPFEKDGDSAYPLQGGSRHSQRSIGTTTTAEGEAEAVSNEMKAASRSFFSFRSEAPSVDVGSFLWGLGYEQLLRFATQPLGELVAFENEGELAHRVGARLPSDPRAWRAAMQRLVREAQLILIRPGDSHGIRWELRTVRACADPRRVLLFFPRDAFGILEDDYKHLVPIVERELGCELPAALPDRVSLIGFSPEWQAVMEVHRGPIPLPWYGGAATAVALSSALEARGLPFRRRPPLRATLNMPLNVGCAVVMLLIFAGACLRGGLSCVGVVP
jgi:hypothetical protein